MDFRNLGRESIRQYLLAYRHVKSGWPSEFANDLEFARARYTAGTHIMCQGRDGDIILQYLFPRTGPPKPQKWFDRKWYDVLHDKSK